MKPSPLAFSINSNGKRQATRQSLGDERDSTDDEIGTEDEIITGFSAMGVHRYVRALFQWRLMLK